MAHPDPRRGATSRVVRASLALLSLLGPFAFLAPPARGADEDVAAAEALLARGEARAALEAFLRLARAPGGADDVRVQAGLGAARMASGDPHGALPPLHAVVRGRGTALDRLRLAEALVAAAEANVESGPQISANVVPYLEDALVATKSAQDPAEDVAARLAHVAGRANWLLGRFADAYAVLGHPGLAKDPAAQDLRARAAYAGGAYADAGEAWLAAGNRRGAAAAWAAARDAKALELYGALARETPGDGALLDEGGMAAAFLGRVDAWDATLAALEPKPEERGGVARARGRLMERAGRLKDAEARHREAVAAAPSDPEARRDLARVLLNRAATDDAAALEAGTTYVGLLREDPQDAVARQGLDFLAQREVALAPKETPDGTRLDRAVAWFRLLAETDPENPVVWAQLGVALRMAGSSAEAVAAYDRAVALNPYDPSLENDRAIARLAAGDRAGALAGFEKAAAADRNETSPRQNAGRLRRLAGDADRAAEHWTAALAATRTVGGTPMLYRSLLDRLWRDRVGASR